jgi:hypothetical protein
MKRYRFKCNPSDPRPMTWPIPHPYWITGYGGGYVDDDLTHATVVAWPDAFDITEDEATDYLFTDRFPKPTWFNPESN